MSIVEFHARLGNTALYYMIIMAGWGLWRYSRKQGLDSNYWGALLIGEILIVVQDLLGGFLWLSGLRPGQPIHLLYGVASALVIPGIWAYTQDSDQRRKILAYSIALLVLIGILLRAISTALAHG